MRNEYNKKVKKDGKGRKQTAPNISNSIAQMFHRKPNLVKKVWADYVRREAIEVSKPPSNSNPKNYLVKIRDTKLVVSKIQEFVRNRREKRERTVAKDVMEFLRLESFLEYNPEDTKSMTSALRAVQRFLFRKGFRRGKKKGCQHYRLKHDIMVKRDNYVIRMTDENAAKQRRIVYMDESYIHQNYCRHEDSLYDPNDEQDLTTVPRHKGRRYCFIAAIIDADRSDAQKAMLLKDTLDIFEGGKKQTKDYHGMFNHDYFVGWMRKLLDALRAREISNAIIVMDNAKYHKKLPPDTPRKGWKKAQLIEACADRNIDVPDKALKSTIWQLLEAHVQTAQPIICNMAKNEGHEVVFSPPHYSDLQPIELVWANVKGQVGRQYTTETKLEDVRLRLEAAFDGLESKTVQGCINKANKMLKKLHDHLFKVDEQEDEDYEEDDTSDSVTSSDEEETSSDEGDSEMDE